MRRNLLGLAALAAFASLPSAPAATFAFVPRHSSYRQGRRTREKSLATRSGNPAGSKLAKKAAKGTLTLNGIR
jgi:hypothetical protein